MFPQTHTLALICFLLILPGCEGKSSSDGPGESDGRQQSGLSDAERDLRKGTEAPQDGVRIAGYLTDGEWIGPELWAVNTKPWEMEIGGTRIELIYSGDMEAKYVFRSNDTGEVSYTFRMVGEFGLRGYNRA